ncbi:MAG: tetratricopeptide repeat protein [Pseudomonadales bacterium]
MIRVVIFGLALLMSGGVLADEGTEAPLVKEATAALQAGDLAMAKLKFEAALGYDQRDAAAYHGLARIHLAQGDLDACEDAIKKGQRYVSRRDDRLRLDLYAVSIGLANARDDFRDARRDYRRALRVGGDDEHAEIHLAMARAHIKAKEYDDARELLNQAIGIPGKYRDEAAATLANMQLIERAAAVSDSDLVYAPQVTRAQVARLLYDELGIVQKMGDTALLAKTAVGETSDQGLTDYADHANQAAIVAVHRMGVRSLNIRNGAFKPGQPISRLELAIIVEDVLAVKQDISRTRFIGTESPYSDLSSNSTGFNAVMTAVTRGLMQVDQSGEIRPNDLVSGAETILVLQKLDSILDKAV